MDYCRRVRGGVGVGGGGSVLTSCIAVVVKGRRPSHPCSTGTKHVGFWRTGQTSRAPSAKYRGMCGEPHEG